MNHPSAVADIIRTHWPVERDKSVNLYLGTGRCGGCFDSYGLQHQDNLSHVTKRVSHTWLSHAEVWHRGRHGIDNMVPLAHLIWDQPPSEPTEYHQQLELAAGRLTTKFVGDGFRYTLEAYTSPAESQRDLITFQLTWEGECSPRLMLVPVAIYASDYSGNLNVECDASITTEGAVLNLKRGNSHGVVVAQVTGDLVTEIGGDSIAIRLNSSAGSGTLTLALGPEVRREQLQTCLANKTNRIQAEAAWLVRWGTHSFNIKSAEHNALAWRSACYLLCTYAPDVRCPAPPMGFTGNAWGYHFPQDLSYVHPALLRMGHSDITRAHVEFYHSSLEDQLALTRNIYNKPGVCWSWEFPIGPKANLFQPEDGGAPNEFQYEIHNAAYPARMAVDTAQVLRDAAWTRAIAWPIVRESARFLASGLLLEAEGKFSMQIKPSMGQDEFGGPNAKNYLCALFATEYTLKQALRLVQELDLVDEESKNWALILEKGLAYDRLLKTEFGFYAANETVPFVPCLQKHPVQLNPLWILPFDHIDEPTRIAYRLRRVICSSERDNQRHGGVPTGFYDGWTLFAFQVSALRMGDTVGLAHELSEMLPSRLVDPNHITIYESSGFWQAYYTTSMGLYLQAVDGANARTTD